MNFIYKLQPAAISTVKFEGRLNLQTVLVFFFRFFRPWLNSKQKEELSRRVCLFKPRVFRTYKLPPFLKTTRRRDAWENTDNPAELYFFAVVYELLNPWQSIHVSSLTSFPCITSTFICINDRVNKSIKNYSFRWTQWTQRFVIFSNESKCLKMTQKSLTLVFQQFVYIVGSKFYSPHFF